MRVTYFILIVLSVLVVKQSQAQDLGAPVENSHLFPFFDKIDLRQNYPNPVIQSPDTKIPYQAIGAKSVAIAVYAGNGQRLMLFENLKNGVGVLKVDTELLAQGVYTYALLIDGRMTH